MIPFETVYAAKFILKEGASQIQLGWIGAAFTLMSFAIFVAWGIWAYLPSRKQSMDEAALLPFEDQDGGAA